MCEWDRKFFIQINYKTMTYITGRSRIPRQYSSHKVAVYYFKVNAASFSVLPIFSCSFKQNGFASGLEHDLEKYVVPTPNMGSGVVYAANLTENPRSLLQTGSKGDSSPNHYINTMKV